MAYTNVISRTDAQALVPEDVSNQLLQGVYQQSAALTLFRSVRLSRNQQRLPVLSALPTAYFVSGDTGLKQTTEENWANKYLNVEEIAAIVPIPENVLDDVDYDIWGEVRPRLEEAIGRVLDAAVFFGTNKPASWPTDIVTASVAAGNTVTRGTNATAAGGLAQDMSDVFGTVEADGFDVNGVIASRTYRGLLRSVRNTLGDVQNDGSADSGLTVSPANIFGVTGDRLQYPMRGLWPTPGAGAAELIAGDFTNGIVGIRQDVTYKLLTESVIQDNSGAIIYNLAQQDMVAMRVVARYAWQVANLINYDQAIEANRYPFAVLRHS